MQKPSYNAIIFFPVGDDRRPRKYRNITRLDNFLKFARSSGGWYVNLYFAKDRKFDRREWLTRDS
jgi:hypothetical protein